MDTIPRNSKSNDRAIMETCLFIIRLKSVIFKCYSSENLIALNTLARLSPPGEHFTAESTEAMRIKCLAQGHNILMPGFVPSTSVSRNRHSDHMTNMLSLM